MIDLQDDVNRLRELVREAGQIADDLLAIPFDLVTAHELQAPLIAKHEAVIGEAVGLMSFLAIMYDARPIRLC